MEPGDPMPYSQELSNSPYSQSNQPNSSHFLKIHSNIVLTSTPRPSPKGLFSEGMPVKILKHS